MSETSVNKTTIALIGQKMDFVVSEISELKITNAAEHKDIINTISSNYVTMEKYARLEDKVNLLQRIVYGAVGLILVGVIGAIINLVLRSKP
jgi:hypothetical protein